MEFNFNDPGNTSNTQQGHQTQAPLNTDVQEAPISTEATQAADRNIKGLSDGEIKNPDSIIATLNKLDKTPIIVLFGARTSGKTMTLIRLAQYLEEKRYNVIPEPTFRPDYDTHYARMCVEFSAIVHSAYAAKGTDPMSFMLVNVISPSGKKLCRILEAPGEHYFDEKIPNRPFPAYIERICATPNRKTWIFLVEESWAGNKAELYTSKVKKMQKKIHTKDHIVFMCHKVDESNYIREDGKPNVPQIFSNIGTNYPSIFDLFKNRNPITRWFSPYKFKFVTFSAGTFTPTGDGRQVYTPGDDYYPEQLWNVIKKNI